MVLGSGSFLDPKPTELTVKFGLLFKEGQGSRDGSRGGQGPLEEGVQGCTP